MRHAQSFDERQALLRQNSKITDQDIEEYKKTEIIRKSIADVKKSTGEVKKDAAEVYFGGSPVGGLNLASNAGATIT